MVCPPATLIAGLRRARHGTRRSPSAGRIATPSRPAPSPAIFRPKCSRMPARRAVIVGHSERRTDHRETRRGRARQGAGGLAGRPDRHRLHRRNARTSATPADTLDVVGAPARRLAAGRRDRRESGHRLRAGLGDRHRPDADAGRRRRGAWLYPRASCARVSARAGRGRPHPLWRLGQAVQCRGTAGGRRRRRRAGRRRQPEGRRFPRHRRAFTAKSAPPICRLSEWQSFRQGSCRDRRDFLYAAGVAWPALAAGVRRPAI